LSDKEMRGIGYKKQKGAKKCWPPYRKMSGYVPEYSVLTFCCHN